MKNKEIIKEMNDKPFDDTYEGEFAEFDRGIRNGYRLLFVTLGIIFVGALIIVLLLHNNMNNACKDAGGTLSGRLCRFGNTFYQVYPKDNSPIPDYILNKYLIGVKNG